MNFKKKVKKLISKSNKPELLVGTLNEEIRIDWVEKTLKSLKPNSRILDAGAGEQQYKKFCAHLNYVSQDFAEYNPEELDSGLQMNKWDYGKLDIISDIASIPEKDASFDAVLCTEVFEHIINPREAIDEFYRLLKKGGDLIITAPFCSLTHFAPYHFYSGFNKYFYETELNNKGFDIVEVDTNGNYFEYVAQEIDRIKKMAKQYSNVDVKKNYDTSIFKVKKLLQELSDKDQGSSELLCFGYHIHAKKR